MDHPYSRNFIDNNFGSVKHYRAMNFAFSMGFSAMADRHICHVTGSDYA